MENKPSETIRELLSSYLKEMGEKFPQVKDSTIVKNLDNLNPDDWKNKKIQLKQQSPLQETEIKQAMVYAKKELIQIRQATQDFLKELRNLPTYQYIKPQADKLISATDDLESLLLNRFNEKQIKEHSPKEWESLQKIRLFLIRQLLETYKKY